MISQIPQNQKIGAVLVVGGGIAGMQAALDCANAGLKVYLLEEQPHIGGNMARLDKTFPTNDCAMCMLSPKLVEIGRHLNVEIISYADMQKLEGQAGNFTVTINKRPRYVDEDKCTGCGDCEAVCPVDIKDTFNGELAERTAIYRQYPQAIPNVFTIDKKELPPPCRASCPAGVNAQGYIALIAKGKFLEALDVVRERMPFAGTCGRICHHPCEENCNRCQIDQPVDVRNLKRFVADYERELLAQGKSIERPESEAIKPEKPQHTEKIAVIGAGPAGLVCADDLAKVGYPVTVFEASDKLGGMMRSGIPDYRLPREYLAREIELILSEGVEVETGKRLGVDITLDGLKEKGYEATFVAIGAQLAKKISLEGDNSEGVSYGMDLLRQINNDEKPTIGKDIVIIGGGNVAMDVARSAIRIRKDATVTIYTLEKRDELPAHDWEVQEALDEGIQIETGWGPARILAKNGTASGIEFVKCTSVFDEQGRFNPKFDQTTKQTVAADTVILAVGQSCDLEGIEGRLDSERGLIATDSLTLETSQKGVFAGGDVVTGPASLVEAVAHGHRAAESIERYLQNKDLRKDRTPAERPTEYAGIPELADLNCKTRQPMSTASTKERKQSFEQIDLGFSREAAIAEAQRCLNCGGCSFCRECVRVCKANAIDHDMKAEQIQINVGAIIHAGGFDPFDATSKAEYGLGRYPNVITSMQFERILSASGPYEGHLVRPSDKRPTKKIAWIQCVGSRDVTCGNDYCSSVCCMYATKEAIIAKEHDCDVETTIFFIDMRAFGKGFESFYNRAERNYGVKYVRSLVSGLKEDPETSDIVVRYVKQDDPAGLAEEQFDMVVLSIGLVANHSTKKIAEICSLDTNRFGFVESAADNQMISSREGIFLCGAAGGPRDIPETVMQASAAAALCGEMLGAVRGTKTTIKEYPTERLVAGEQPRIGIFVCHCGSNIASVVDVEELEKYAQTIPGVVHVERNLYTCSQDTQEKMKEIVEEKNLNRIIVASCTPRTHEPLFQETLRQAGLNKYLFDMADIREQCSWVHQKEHERATEKAKSLVRGSVAKSKLLEPLEFKKVGVTKAALVLGGGISGLTAALSLAEQGFETHVIEKNDRLGGQIADTKYIGSGNNWQKYLDKTIRQVTGHEKISVHTGCSLDRVGGFIGNFTTTLKGQSQQEIKHGIIIVATGAEEYRTENFLFGENQNVLTQRQLEEQLAQGRAAQNVVMIQCVGSRDDARPYCSRVCCGQAIQNAIELKKQNPNAKVHILYRDIRTYEYLELEYRKARELGVVFIHFPDEKYPTVTETQGELAVTVHDTVIGCDVRLKAEMLVLSTATVPDSQNNQQLAEMLKVSLNEDGYFMEAHVKLRPTDFANEGIYVCGLAHSPKYTIENITQSLAAAARAACTLAKDTLEVGGVVSVVDQDKCASCLTCLRECVYDAPFINEDGKAEIESAKCQGCGNCTAACPAKAIQLQTFTDSQEKMMFKSILKPEETTIC